MNPDVKKGLYLISIGFTAGIGFIFGIIFVVVFHHGVDIMTAFKNIFGWAILVLLIGTLIVIGFQFLEEDIAVGIGYLVVILILGIFLLIFVFNI